MGEGRLVERKGHRRREFARVRRRFGQKGRQDVEDEHLGLECTRESQVLDLVLGGLGRSGRAWSCQSGSAEDKGGDASELTLTSSSNRSTRGSTTSLGLRSARLRKVRIPLAMFGSVLDGCPPGLGFEGSCRVKGITEAEWAVSFLVSLSSHRLPSSLRDMVALQR